jgi:CRISPR-associated protein Csx14
LPTSVKVDPSNPGQFFACCGLLELADRLWPNTEGWFEDGEFRVAVGGTLNELIHSISHAELIQLDAEDNTSSPVRIAMPFDLRLDWWLDDRAGGRDLKVWARTMKSVRIARAMQHAMQKPEFQSDALLDIGVIAYDPENSEKKVEPYYFDSRRGPNAHSRDVGFAPNDLHLTTTAFPAVEFLCLVGLQRVRPVRYLPRIFDYHTWLQPLPPELIPAAVSGLLPHAGLCGYRFENWYRTGQKKHKAFLSATPIPLRGDQ